MAEKKKETVENRTKKCILKDPSLTDKEVAVIVGTTNNFAKLCRVRLRKEKKLPPVDKDYRRKKVTLPAPANEVTEKTEEEILKEKIVKLFKRRDVLSFEEISDYFNTGIGNVKKFIADLVKEGYNFSIKDTHAIVNQHLPKADPVSINIKKMSTGFYRFGVCGDNHLGSKYERLDALNALYDLFESEGIKVVYNTGNWIDGEARFNKHDLHTHGMGNQVDYFIQNYPQRKGITTYYIAGDDHEGWYVQREGVDIGKFTELKARDQGRKDLVYLGYMEADVVLKAPQGKTTIRVHHPGGGSAYATSYSVQKIVESYQDGEKPDVLLVGHFHKSEYLPVRGVHCIQTACTEDQTPFMRKKRLAAAVGGWIVEMATDDNGAITRFKVEYMPFYNKKYYQKWAYKWK